MKQQIAESVRVRARSTKAHERSQTSIEQSRKGDKKLRKRACSGHEKHANEQVDSSCIENPHRGPVNEAEAVQEAAGELQIASQAEERQNQNIHT